MVNGGHLDPIAAKDTIAPKNITENNMIIFRFT